MLSTIVYYSLRSINSKKKYQMIFSILFLITKLRNNYFHSYYLITNTNTINDNQLIVSV